MDPVMGHGEKDPIPLFRLLSVSSSPSLGGLERFQLEVARAMAARGHTVEVAGEPGSPFGRRAAELGLTLHEVSFRRRFSPRSVLRLARLFRRVRPDVIHYRYSRDIWTIAPAARLSGLTGRVVHTLGMNPGGRLRNPVHRWLRAALGAFVVPSPRTGERAAEVWGMAPGQVTHLPNWVTETPFLEPDLLPEALRLRESWGVPPGLPLVGMLARLEPAKGVERFVEAGLQVLAAHPEPVRFVVAGPTMPGQEPWLAGLQERIAAAGGAGAFLFPGGQERVPPFLKALDLFVLPSRGETFGLVLVEAMLAGCPVVAFTGPGPDYILAGGGYGTLLPEGKEGVLAGSLLTLLGDPAERNIVGDSGRRHARARFTEAVVAPRYEALFTSIRQKC
jgi:glycosyltransferase involved in cell wall biosynthesis